MNVIITGASGFIGGAIADRLIGRDEIRSLTSHPGKNRFGERVRSFAYDFDAPMRMEGAFRGVDAFADLAVEAIDGAHGQVTLPVAGPNDWVFLDLVRAVHAAVGSRARIVHAPAELALAGLKIAGFFLGDVVLTPDEVKGLTHE